MKRIAQGNTAEIFEYRKNIICKLFYSGYPTEYIKHEFYNAKLVLKLGIRTPKAHKLTLINGRKVINMTELSELNYTTNSARKIIYYWTHGWISLCDFINSYCNAELMMPIFKTNI